MRILIAADTYYPNTDGASYFTQRLACGLKARGHDMLVIAPGVRVRTTRFTHDNIDIFALRSLPTFFHKQYRFTAPVFLHSSIKKLIQEFKPDVVHVQGHFFVEKMVAQVAKECGIPVVGTNHFMPENLVHYLHLPTKIRDNVIRFAWNSFLKVFNTLDAVTTPTQSGVDLLRRIGFTKPASPVSCGIDLERFYPAREGNPQLLKKYHIPGDKKILLCVGRLAPEKNVDCILRALAIVRDPSIHFVVVGSGMEKTKLARLTKKLHLESQVTFTGFVPDDELPQLYRIADCFVTAGEVELQSLVTMEAMASGLPVIAINKLALPELVHPGENGYLFDYGSTRQLAQQIKKIVGDDGLRAVMARKSRERILSHGIDNTFEKFEKIYTQLANR